MVSKLDSRSVDDGSLIDDEKGNDVDLSDEDQKIKAYALALFPALGEFEGKRTELEEKIAACKAKAKKLDDKSIMRFSGRGTSVPIAISNAVIWKVSSGYRKSWYEFCKVNNQQHGLERKVQKDLPLLVDYSEKIARFNLLWEQFCSTFDENLVPELFSIFEILDVPHFEPQCPIATDLWTRERVSNDSDGNEIDVNAECFFYYEIEKIALMDEICGHLEGAGPARHYAGGSSGPPGRTA